MPDRPNAIPTARLIIIVSDASARRRDGSNHRDPYTAQAVPAGQQLQVEVAEGGVGEDLEDGVEGDEDGGHLPVAAREIVPDQHDGDAAGQPDEDDPGAVGGLVG